ncbi:Heavy metal transport/detoxification superfamily protein [Striga hermonthica]|uniref:Heavy metal transport/detoxification superfamily protein n=1 Tax=Striga hermonthica TaxID=68872 RepID=A0A9N7NFZ2_STRHE|nr:Heavy metal transport/detoxification superfamily protein [Striga hermonthica]
MGGGGGGGTALINYLISNLCTTITGQHNKSSSKRKSMQTVEIKVKMDCDGCERKVKNAAKNIRGVKSVQVNRKMNQIKVSGYVEPQKVLQRVVKKTGKRAEFWPYIPFNRVQTPHLSQVYDKKAPAGYVKNVQTAIATSNATDQETLTNLFSDDNTNACSIM